MDYLETFSLSATNYEQKKSEINEIYNEIDVLSEQLSSFVQSKYKVKIMFQRELINDPTLSPIELLANSIGSSLISELAGNLKPYLCFVNELGEKLPIALFKLSDSGYPVVAKYQSNESHIKNLDNLRHFFETLIKEYSFFENLDKFATTTKAKLEEQAIKKLEEKNDVAFDTENAKKQVGN